MTSYLKSSCWYPIAPFRRKSSFSVFSRTAARVTAFPSAVDLVRFTGELYSSADIVLNMIKIFCLQKFEFSLVFFIYSLFTSIRVYKTNIFESRNKR